MVLEDKGLDISRRTLPEVILLDHDGTLVDSEAVHFRLWEVVLSPYGVTLPKSLYGAEFVGLSELETAKALQVYFDLSVAAGALLAKKLEAVDAYQQSQAFPILPSVSECLASWHRAGVRLAVVSGSNQATVRRSVSACGWDDLLEDVFTGDQVARNKPAPDVYQLALGCMGVSPSNAVAIEDSCTGLSAATAAGIPCYVVSNDWSSGQDFSAALEVVSLMSDVQQSLVGSLDTIAG